MSPELAASLQAKKLRLNGIRISGTIRQVVPFFITPEHIRLNGPFEFLRPKHLNA